MVMTGSGNSPPHDGKAMLEHVVTVVLKQAKDGLLAKALDAAAFQEINDVFLLNQPARDALTFLLDDGTEKPLPIGYKNLLRALKIFANHCQANGHPIGDWTTITKKDFDDFRCSQVCMAQITLVLDFYAVSRRKNTHFDSHHEGCLGGWQTPRPFT